MAYRNSLVASLAPGLLTACLTPSVALADFGELLIKGGATVVYQREVKSGEDDTSASGDLMFTLPAGNGSWFMYVEGATGTGADSIFNTYPEVNGDANSVLDRDGGGHIQVSELLYRLNIGERYQLLLGQIDTSAQIDRSRIANDENSQYLGASFVNNPTIAFPDYAIGTLLRRHARDRSPELTLILSASDGIADNPSRSYSELVDITGAGKGVFASLSARWLLGATEFGAGLWARTDDHPKLENEAESSRNRGAFAVYGLAHAAHSWNVRAGIANEAVSRAARFLGVAYEWKGSAGTLGLGAARIFESRRAGRPATGDTDHLEAWFRMPLISDTLHLTADLQYVHNPGFDASGTLAEVHALLAAFRVDFKF